jgi:WD and tetratricopeptide repeat-containing protein 1
MRCISMSYMYFFLQVETGNPNVVWSASEDGTLRQHDFREGTSCPPAGSPHQECHSVLVSGLIHL